MARGLIYGNAVAIDGGEIELDSMIDGGEIELDNLIDGGEVGVFFSIGGTPYTGETEVTPTEDTQYLLTQGYFMSANVKVNPIPTNYGKITWDGTKIIVS